MMTDERCAGRAHIHDGSPSTKSPPRLDRDGLKKTAARGGRVRCGRRGIAAQNRA